MTSIVIITNIPAPYRNPVYQVISDKLGFESFHVVFCANKESNRQWVIDQLDFSHIFLKPNVMERKGRYIHNNCDIWGVLNRMKPEVVITTGFNPTHLYAFAWACLNGKTHIPMTDGTLKSEDSLLLVHRLLRSIVYRFSSAFIGASIGSKRLYGSYNVPAECFFQSHLCANNVAFNPSDLANRTYDFMFCGRFSSEKNPLFAIDVAREVAMEIGRRVSLLFVGSGPMAEEVKAYASKYAGEVDSTFKGFVQPENLPELYCSAKIFLFPTSWDPWGVVANEACAAGQVVMVSPHAGVAGELIVHKENGYVLPLELPLWVKYGTNILNDDGLLNQFSERSLQQVQKFTYADAASGVIDAVSFAVRSKSQPDSLAMVGSQQELRKKSVVIIQRRLCDYRAPLFQQLKTLLIQDRIDLHLLYGDPTLQEQSKQDAVDLAWGEKLATHYFFGNRICWQPFFKKVQGADLVIVTQENKLVCNLWPLFGWRNYKLAFWGHGKNMQVSSSLSGKFKERIKSLTTNHVDWWFAYTGVSRDLVKKSGFSKDKITNLENAVDTLSLKELCDAVTKTEMQAIRVAHNLGEGPVGIYVGSLYKDKRLEFLLRAGQLISQKIPDFRLVVIGSGPQRGMIENAQQEFPWLRYVGRKVEREKAQYLKMASVLLNPGLVGLGILDGFAAGIPIVTTNCGMHSPEIDYLRQGENGFMTENNVEDYVQTVVRILTDSALANHLHKGSLEASKHYTIENMAENFRAGIVKALG